MAIRRILKDGEELLLKTSRPVTEFNDRLHTLLEDMADTLLESGGVGLAAPQVGVLRRVVLVIETNVGEDEDEFILELINPEIIAADGEQRGTEGCLSFPGQYGIVTRPNWVRVRAQDRFGSFFEVEGEALTARCFCHEVDHLNGVVFPQRAERMLRPEELDQ